MFHLQYFLHMDIYIFLLPIFTAMHPRKALVICCLFPLIASNWCLHLIPLFPLQIPSFDLLLSLIFINYKFHFYFTAKEVLVFIWHISVVKCLAKVELPNLPINDISLFTSFILFLNLISYSLCWTFIFVVVPYVWSLWDQSVTYVIATYIGSCIRVLIRVIMVITCFIF